MSVSSVCSSAQPALNASTVEVTFSHALSTWRYFSVIRGNTMGNTSMKELVLVFLSGQGVFTLKRWNRGHTRSSARDGLLRSHLTMEARASRASRCWSFLMFGTTGPVASTAVTLRYST